MLSPHLPILAPSGEWVMLKAACTHADVKDWTMRDWVRRYGIGRQTSPQAPIFVHLPALQALLGGDLETLELIREGVRFDPRIRRIYEYLLIPVPKNCSRYSVAPA